MSVNQKSGHGTLIAVQLTPGGAFTDIAELGDVTPPELMRNEFDGTTQNEDIDSYTLGVLRRGLFSTTGNAWVPDNNTHDHLTGVQKLLKDNTMTGWRITYPQVVPSLTWIMSGQVKKFQTKAPVDGRLTFDLDIRLSGKMNVGAVVFG